MKQKLFDRVALVGIGLIGSSLARATGARQPLSRVIACARKVEDAGGGPGLGIGDNDP